METKQRSRNQFCRCGHNRSFQALGLRHICGDLKCECVKHDTATKPPKAKLSVVETPAPEVEEETVETPTLSDAELLADWSAMQERL